MEQTEQEFWKRGGNLGFNRDSIAREQQALKEQDIALKAEALIIASNPATPLCLCPMLVQEAYKRIKHDEESRAKRYSLPIITRMYGNLLANFRTEFPDSSDSYQKLVEIVNSQLEELENTSANDRTNTLTPLAQALIEKVLSEDDRSIRIKASNINSDHEKVIAALAQLEVHLSSNAEKHDTINILNKIKELQAKKTQLETEITRCDEQIKSANYESEQLERRQNKIMLKMASDADSSDDNVRIAEYSTMFPPRLPAGLPPPGYRYFLSLT